DQRRRTVIARIACVAGAIGSLGLAASLPALARAEQAAPQPGAARDLGAEQFVQTQGQRLVTILVDKSRSADVRIRAFRDALHDIADIPRIARFTLGKHARTITPDQMQRFLAVFEDYEQNVYRQRLTDFHGDTLT